MKHKLKVRLTTRVDELVYFTFFLHVIIFLHFLSFQDSSRNKQNIAQQIGSYYTKTMIYNTYCYV